MLIMILVVKNIKIHFKMRITLEILMIKSWLIMARIGIVISLHCKRLIIQYHGENHKHQVDMQIIRVKRLSFLSKSLLKLIANFWRNYKIVIDWLDRLINWKKNFKLVKEIISNFKKKLMSLKNKLTMLINKYVILRKMS